MANPVCDAVQLYTVRNMTSKDFAQTVKQVAALGYKHVELAGYGNASRAQAAKEALDAAGLKAVSGHYGLDMLEKKLDDVMADAKTLEIDTIVCPYLPDDRRGDAKAYERLAKTLEQIGGALHQQGYILAYHNHDFEFKDVGGKTALDVLFENTPAHLVAAEVDVYWVKHAGADPVALINKLGDRVRLLHLKDLADGPDKKFAPVGTGIIDFKAILDAARKLDVRYGIVEQDQTYDMPPLEALKISMENLKKLDAV